MQDKAFAREFVDLIYGATNLMRETCSYFLGQPNGEPYEIEARWTNGKTVSAVPIKVDSEDWEAWSNLTHINNIANCTEMIESGVYEHGEEKRIFDHKIKSSNILANKEDNSMNHIVRVPDVAKSFLLQFCTSKGITKLLTTKPV